MLTNIKFHTPASFDSKLAKTYKTKHSVELKTSPFKTDCYSIAIIPEGTKVLCYGYYEDDWYYVSYENITGYCHKNEVI